MGRHLCPYSSITIFVSLGRTERRHRGRWSRQAKITNRIQDLPYWVAVERVGRPGDPTVPSPVFRAAAVFAAISAIGYSCAAAQSTESDVSAGARALSPLPGSELQDTLRAWREPPQAVGPDRSRGALWGGGIGFVTGGLLGGLTATSGDEDDFGSSLTESAVTGEAVLLGAVVGAGIGALLGATLLAPSHRPTSGDGVGLTFSIHRSSPAVAASGRVRIGW